MVETDRETQEPEIAVDLKTLIRQQRPGFTLARDFYCSEDIFQLDLAQVLAPQWLYVDHVSRLPHAGDFLTYEFANESIIIVRGHDGELHAHFNVCRHRGSRICLKASGNLRRLVCPYHAWTYGLDGNLEIARHMPADFDTGAHGLHPCRIQVFEGLIFVSLSGAEVADFGDIEKNLGRYFRLHGLARAKVAHREVFPTRANWKLAVDNFRECYHCAHSHPQYTKVYAYVRQAERDGFDGYQPAVDAWAKKARAEGWPTGDHDFYNWLQPHHVWRMPIRDGYSSLTEDGKPAAPLMGEFEQHDGSETGVFLGALSGFILANDHGTTFRFTPLSSGFTELVVTWLVHEDAQEGVDYDLDHLKWMWHHTVQQDTQIINDNQQGVHSTRYVPGPYSNLEAGAASFTQWYLSRLLQSPHFR